jgi:hypothetical protein
VFFLALFHRYRQSDIASDARFARLAVYVRGICSVSGPGASQYRGAGASPRACPNRVERLKAAAAQSLLDMGAVYSGALPDARRRWKTPSSGLFSLPYRRSGVRPWVY